MTADEEKAKSIRERLTAALAPAIDVLNGAVKDGFNVSFNIGGEPMTITKIDVSKRL